MCQHHFFRGIMEVKLVDHMGSDLSVVNAARVSFAKEHKEFDEGKAVSYTHLTLPTKA